MKILYLFIISIIVSVSIYPAFALDTPICDANSLPHYGPHNPSHIYITDTSGNLPYIPLTEHTVILHDDDVWNTYPEPKTVQVTLTIQNQDTGQQIFNQTQSLQMQACSGPESVKWRFVPIQVANYIATVSDNRDKENMIFNSMLDATKSQTVSSPLEQLRFGILPKDIQCKQGLDLIIKIHDNMPACVKPETAQTLIMRGWGTFTVPPIDNTYDQKMNGTISGNVVLAGGPRSGPQANYEVDVYTTDGVTIVGKTLSDDNGNYSIQLLAGNYTIYAPDYPIEQTHFVSVYPHKNTIFNIVYGTGYK